MSERNRRFERAAIIGLGVLALSGRAAGETPPGDGEPTADFDVSVNGLTITLTSQANDPDNQITLREWEVSTATGTLVATGTGETLEVDVQNEGDYHATHTVTSASGQTATRTRPVTVGDGGGGNGGTDNARPDATWTYDTSPLRVDMESTATDPDGSIVSYSWEWTALDGTLMGTESGPTATFTFDQAGTWGFTHFVEDDDGAVDSNFKIVDVPGDGGGGGNQAPEALMSVFSVGPEMTANDLGSSDPDGTIVSRKWDVFDPMNTETPIYEATGESFTAEFGPQEYIVRLTVEDNDGATDTAQESVVVDFGADDFDMVEYYDGDVGTWEQAVFTSYSLNDRRGRDPEHAVVNGLSGALRDLGVSHVIYYNLPLEAPPNDRTGCCDVSESDCSTPDGDDDAYYWWRDRLQANSQFMVHGKDSNLLLLDNVGGGCGGVNGIACVSGAASITSDVSYDPGPHPAGNLQRAEVHAALHEVGHNMGFSHDPHAGTQENNHDQGWWERTPTVGTDEPSTNVCGAAQEGREYSQTAYWNRYAFCVRQQMKIAPDSTIEN